MKKPLIIITQDEFFEQWFEKKKEAEIRLEEERMFFEKRFLDSLTKYLEPVWKELIDECVRRGYLKEGEVKPLEREDGEKWLSIEDGVVFLKDTSSKPSSLSFLSKLFD